MNSALLSLAVLVLVAVAQAAEEPEDDLPPEIRAQLLATYIQGKPGQVQTRYISGQPGQVETRYINGKPGQVQTRYISGQPGQVETRYISGRPGQVETQYIDGQPGQVETRYINGKPGQVETRYIDGEPGQVETRYIQGNGQPEGSTDYVDMNDLGARSHYGTIQDAAADLVGGSAKLAADAISAPFSFAANQAGNALDAGASIIARGLKGAGKVADHIMGAEPGHGTFEHIGDTLGEGAKDAAGVGHTLIRTAGVAHMMFDKGVANQIDTGLHEGASMVDKVLG